MNTVQNGKGSRARNNWGKAWYAGYDAVDWHHGKPVAKKSENPSTTNPKHGAAPR
jgi:hypothetical protein